MKHIISKLDTIAYFSGCGGIEVKHIEYGATDFVYFIAGAWTGNKTAHKARIYYSSRPFIRFHGYRIPLDEFLTV